MLTLCNRKPSQLVSLYACDEAQNFVVHKEFACHFSPVLKAAFDSQFVEGQTQIYRLQDTTERAIRFLTHWFYTQTLDTKQGREVYPGESILSFTEIQNENLGLVELWVLAEKLLIPRLQNMVAHEILRIQQTAGTSTYCIQYVYQNTTAGSPLRVLYLYQCAAYLHSSSYAAKPERYPQEMLIDLVTLFAGALPFREKKNLRLVCNFKKFEVQED